MDTEDPDLVRELAEARVTDAVTRRRRRRRRETFDATSISTSAVLTMHAALHDHLTVHTSAGGVHRGRLRWVGDGIVVLSGETSGTVVVIDAITHIDAPGAATPAADVPRVAGTVRLGDLLAELAGERAEVGIELVGGAAVRGRLDQCGSDVCRVSAATGDGAAYVWLVSVTAVSSSSIS